LPQLKPSVAVLKKKIVQNGILTRFAGKIYTSPLCDTRRVQKKADSAVMKSIASYRYESLRAPRNRERLITVPEAKQPEAPKNSLFRVHEPDPLT
jgi:hypothetical protein